MSAITSISASAVSSRELGDILLDYLALDRARGFRRLLVKRCGLLVLGALAVATLVTGLSPFARSTPLALLVAPPVVAWIVELRFEYRLSRRLDRIDPS